MPQDLTLSFYFLASFGPHWSSVVIDSREEMNNVLQGIGLISFRSAVWINESTNQFGFAEIDLEDYIPDNTGKFLHSLSM